MNYTVSLHTHLEGSIRPATFYELMGEDAKEQLTVTKNCSSLKEFLDKIAYGCPLIKKRANITRVAYECVETASKNNCLYLEIRFGPALHTTGDMQLPDTIEAVLEGLQKGEKDFGTVARLIIATLRDATPASSIELAKLAVQYKNQGVVGFDIAGDEANFPAYNHQKAFEIAKLGGLGITVHAGEAGSAANVAEAILKLGATRIGHGIRVVDDPNVVTLAKERGVVFEVCPTSNVHTGAVNSLEEHPLKEMVEEGLLVTINDDDPETSQISLRNEYDLALKLLENKLSRKQLLENALRASFVEEKVKNHLLTVIR